MVLILPPSSAKKLLLSWLPFSSDFDSAIGGCFGSKGGSSGHLHCNFSLSVSLLATSLACTKSLMERVLWPGIALQF
jgi:hypothetical protein